MVVLDEYFHHKAAKARRRCHCGSETAQSEKSLARRITDVASPRRRRGTSISSVFQNRPLVIDHCSLIFERSADAYGSTLIFTAPGPDGLWFTDDDVQSDCGGNEIIYCGYRYDAESQLYYVRNWTYNPVLGRWIRRDPVGYARGINLYEYVGSSPGGRSDTLGQDWHKLTHFETKMPDIPVVTSPYRLASGTYENNEWINISYDPAVSCARDGGAYNYDVSPARTGKTRKITALVGPIKKSGPVRSVKHATTSFLGVLAKTHWTIFDISYYEIYQGYTVKLEEWTCGCHSSGGVGSWISSIVAASWYWKPIKVEKFAAFRVRTGEEQDWIRGDASVLDWGALFSEGVKEGIKWGLEE